MFATFGHLSRQRFNIKRSSSTLPFIMSKTDIISCNIDFQISTYIFILIHFELILFDLI